MDLIQQPDRTDAILDASCRPSPLWHKIRWIDRPVVVDIVAVRRDDLIAVRVQGDIWVMAMTEYGPKLKSTS